MKNNKYLKIKKEEIEDIILKISENKVNIEQLDDSQKDSLIEYYNKKICIKKEYIKNLKETIQKKKGSI